MNVTIKYVTLIYKTKLGLKDVVLKQWWILVKCFTGVISFTASQPDSQWHRSNDVYRICAILQCHLFEFLRFPFGKNEALCVELLSANFCPPGCIFVSHVSNVTDLKEANPTGSITIPLRRQPAAIHPDFMQFSSTYF